MHRKKSVKGGVRRETRRKFRIKEKAAPALIINRRKDRDNPLKLPILMSKVGKNSVLVAVAVLIVAPLVFLAVTRRGAVQPKITSVTDTKEAIPDALKEMLSADVFPVDGVTVRQNQTRKISDGSEQIVFAYEVKKDAGGIYTHFRKYCKDNGFSINTDTISPFVSPSRFSLVADKGGSFYGVLVRQDNGSSSSVVISFVKK